VQQAGNAHHGAMKPGRSTGPPPWWVWALSAVAFACLAPATASAAPTITGGDDDIWNAARPVPSYVIASTLADRTRISWRRRSRWSHLRGGRARRGRSRSTPAASAHAGARS
jgi:hypothetical protein